MLLEANQASFVAELDEAQRQKLLVGAIRDYAIYLLDPQGRVASWNAGAQRFKGYRADEIIGQHFSRFYTEADRALERPARALQTALEQGRFEDEGWRVRRDGTWFWTSVVIDAIFDDDSGALVGFAKITRDITEKRDAQLELERNRFALAESQKHDSVGRLSGGIAHEFNNLLTVVLSSTELLKRPDLPAHKRERYLDAITHAADRATRLTGHLLAYARRQPLASERIDVASRLHELTSIFETLVGPGLTLVIRAEPGLFIEADPSQFDVALYNIVVNAKDALGGQGEVALTARRETRASAQSAGDGGSWVKIAIADTGSGIDEAHLSRVFEPFFTTKGKAGSGLGLSQVYGFAKQSRGDVRISSAVGQGTTVELALPSVFSEDADCGKPSSPEPCTRHRSVLIVDDNDQVREVARALFDELAEEVTMAADAASAFRILTEREGDIDLVFSDVLMPGENGVHFAKRVAARWPALRVVLTTGFSEDICEAGTSGFELVRKPFSLGDIGQVMNGLCRGSDFKREGGSLRRCAV